MFFLDQMVKAHTPSGKLSTNDRILLLVVFICAILVSNLLHTWYYERMRTSRVCFKEYDPGYILVHCHPEDEELKTNSGYTCGLSYDPLTRQLFGIKDRFIVICTKKS